MKPLEQAILVAEDSPTQAERLRLLLEGEGFRVELARNGVEGLEKVRSAAPDLIISDALMPGMDGYAFCHAIKSRDETRRIPFVLFTERHAPMDIIEGLLQGADNFIPKSASDEYLLARVRRIFEQLQHRKGQFNVEIVVRVGDREIPISADKQQIFELLISTLDETSRVNDELQEARRLLEEHARGLEREVEERTREVRASEERYRALFEASPLPLWMFDLETLGFLAVNDAAIEKYGYSREEFLGMSIKEIRPPEDVPAMLEALAKGPESIRTQGTFRHRKKDGTLIDVEISAHDFLLEGRRARLVLANDITERQRLEAQLVHSQKMESVGRLAGGVAHDFNNLLGVITGYGELLRRRLPPDERLHKYADDILKAAERAAGLTRQLLAFSRKQVLQPRILDLNAVVGEMDKMLRRLIGEDVYLVTLFAEGLGAVKADPGQMEQILMNLAVNARDAMPRGGRLTIETANAELGANYARLHPGLEPGLYVMMAVSDTGQGMSPETKAHLFEPFFTTKEEGKGTGLGLATVHGIVKQSGGHIFVYSEPGHGTSFKIYFPRVGEAARAAEAQPVGAPPRGSETVLLAEDEAGLRSLVRECLEASGYAVLEAQHGAEALDLCETHLGPIHLLLTDVVMPGITGRELAERAAGRRPEMKVLYMSGYTDDDMVLRGVMAEDMAYLQKPFTADGLVRKVREVLDAPSSASS